MAKGDLLYRCEHNDWEFLENYSALFDGVVIFARYLAPYPPDHPADGKDPSRLLTAARKSGRSAIVDPDTPGLTSQAVRRNGAARLRRTPTAQATDLPVEPTLLSERQRLEAFVDAHLESHAGNDNDVVAPYLDSRSRTEFGINIRMLERTVASIGPERAVGVLQGTRARLVNGDLSQMAPRIAATGVRRALIRVRGLRAEEATAEEVLAYAWLVDLFDRHRVEPVPDCVGRLGPFLVSSHGHAFTTGAHNFRSVPAALLSVSERDPDGDNKGGGGRPVTYERSDGGEMPRNEAPAVPDSLGRKDSSAVQSDSPRSLDRYRAQRLHVLRAAGRQAAEEPETFLRQKQGSEDAHERLWATALLDRLRRTA